MIQVKRNEFERRCQVLVEEQKAVGQELHRVGIENDKLMKQLKDQNGHIQELEDQQETMQSDNDRLLNRSEQLEVENTLLRERVEELESERRSGDAAPVVLLFCECF